jgi:hypothetical protein
MAALGPLDGRIKTGRKTVKNTGVLMVPKDPQAETDKRV